MRASCQTGAAPSSSQQHRANGERGLSVLHKADRLARALLSYPNTAHSLAKTTPGQHFDCSGNGAVLVTPAMTCDADDTKPAEMGGWPRASSQNQTLAIRCCQQVPAGDNTGS